MKVLLVVHGYPPELVGGTEVSVQALAQGLVEQGAEVVVVAGSMDHAAGFRVTEARDGDVLVKRIHRADLYFDHWQKSASARVASAFKEILRAEKPDVVHVHHWLRLTRDLVRCAAEERIPAVVTLHDLWTTCLVTFRVRPDTKEFCERTLGPDPCLSCAALVPPRTPWVALENQFLALGEHRADLIGELQLARTVVVPSRAHADAIQSYLGIDNEPLNVRVVPHGRELALEARAPRAFDGTQLVLGAWGHVHPLKGQDLLIEALRRLPDPSRVALRIAGGEPDADFAARIRREASGLDVSILGPYSVDELALHDVTDVHAMVSGTRARETWGLVLDEAVALELPLILPRAGAFPERLEEGRGALFYEAGDAGSLAEVIERLLDEPRLLTEVRAGLPRVDAFLSTTAQHVATIVELYESAIEDGPPAVPDADWWKNRMRLAAEEEWDESLKRRSAEELGFA